MTLKKILSNLSGDKKKTVIVILGIAGILLIFVSELIHSEGSQAPPEQPPDTDQPMTVESYRKQLEDELERIVSAIDGTGNVQILITMDSTIEDVYAVEKNIDEKASKSGEEGSADSEGEYKEENRYVIIKNKDGSETTILQKQVMPRIRGVLIVCDGGGSQVTKEKVTKAVSSVLNISSGKVFVTD